MMQLVQYTDFLAIGQHCLDIFQRQRVPTDNATWGTCPILVVNVAHFDCSLMMWNHAQQEIDICNASPIQCHEVVHLHVEFDILFCHAQIHPAAPHVHAIVALLNESTPLQFSQILAATLVVIEQAQIMQCICHLLGLPQLGKIELILPP